jgi:hypothetical protein
VLIEKFRRPARDHLSIRGAERRWARSCGGITVQ